MYEADLYEADLYEAGYASAWHPKVVFRHVLALPYMLMTYQASACIVTVESSGLRVCMHACIS